MEQSPTSICNRIIARCQQATAGLEAVEKQSPAADVDIISTVAATTSKLSVLDVELQDKRVIIDRLNELLASTRQQHQKEVAEITSRLNAEVQSQRNVLGEERRSHAKEIEKLNNSVTRLQDELHIVKARHEREVEAAQEQCTKSMARQKQTLLAAEKVKREEWEKQKVKEIKELTVKGMEPELERLLAQRGRERQQLQECHQGALDRQRVELISQAQQQAQEECRRVLFEEEMALQRCQEEQRAHLAERQRHFAEEILEMRLSFQDDLSNERRRMEGVCNEKMETLAVQEANVLAVRSSELEMKVSEAKARTRQMDEHMQLLMLHSEESAREAAREDYRRQLLQVEAAHSRQEEQLEKKWSSEAEAQLRNLTETLEARHTAESKRVVADAHASFDRKDREAKRTLAQAQAQIESLEGQQQAAQEALSVLHAKHDAASSLAAQLGAREAELARAQSEWKSAAAAANHTLQQEQEAMRKSHARQLEGVTDEMMQLDRCLDEERARRVQQARESKQREEAAIEKVLSKEKEVAEAADAARLRTIQAKDEALAELRVRCAAAESKVKHLEQLLQRQRDELLEGMTKRMA